MDRISFHQLFSALPSPHMIVDRDLIFSAVNRAYEEVTMQTGENLVGRNLFDAFPNDGESGRRVRSSLDRVFQTAEPDTLAYVEYEIPIAGDPKGGFETRYWTAVHTPLLDERGEVAFVLQNTVDITEMVRLRAAASLPFQAFPGELELVQRAREAEEAYQDTLKQTDEFRRIFDQAPGMVALLQGPRHIFTFANEAYRTFVGGREILGLSLVQALPEIKGQGIEAAFDDVYRTGKARIAHDQRVLIADAGGTLREAFVDFSYHPIRTRDGEISGIFVQSYDRTQSVRALQQQRLLIDELNHRVKNTLSTVQSLARRSFRTNEDREDARRVFEARILALSNAHNLLSEQRWESADLRTILQLELGAFGDERFVVDGPSIPLTPRAAIALAMVFHELASNAVKYGGLSQAGGGLSIHWKVTDGRLVFQWEETGLPGDAQEPRPGFGMRMLERIVTGELEGNLMVDFRADRLTWRFDIKRTEVEDMGRSDDD
ncbi:sensor histidine kinase [Aureimonas pseudogalii]|uniref:Blue-light-activated histidine kinase n=1 Tax=Aureimonas pseudogalii TaxID=1744844 RepID=A0A7W6EEW1_9HYPH|nr:HWE histidine kinase domain-containing protein [Aureimonas pseudogalii]MBB3998112.1 PAS domain S-box-containing protein [Aureimonas pseudogalii]